MTRTCWQPASAPTGLKCVAQCPEFSFYHPQLPRVNGVFAAPFADQLGLPEAEVTLKPHRHTAAGAAPAVRLAKITSGGSFGTGSVSSVKRAGMKKRIRQAPSPPCCATGAVIAIRSPGACATGAVMAIRSRRALPPKM